MKMKYHREWDMAYLDETAFKIEFVLSFVLLMFLFDAHSRAETLDKLDNDIKEYTETESQLKQEYEETIRTKATA